MSLSGFLNSDTSDRTCAEWLQEEGFDIHPLSRYAIRPGRQGLVFGFTAFTRETIRESLKRFAIAMQSRPR